MEDDVRIVYKTATMWCIRLTMEGEDRILVLGIAKDTKEPVMVGHFAERGGEYIFFPTVVGWQFSDMQELLKAFEHFESGV